MNCYHLNQMVGLIGFGPSVDCRPSLGLLYSLFVDRLCFVDRLYFVVLAGLADSLGGSKNAR